MTSKGVFVKKLPWDRWFVNWHLACALCLAITRLWLIIWLLRVDWNLLSAKSVKLILLKKKSLQSHIQGVHKKEKSHSCSQCDKSLFKLWDLNWHSNVHNEKNLYKCKICETALRISASLNIHMRSHSGGTPYHCGMCGRDSSQNGNMSTH